MNIIKKAIILPLLGLIAISFEASNLLAVSKPTNTNNPKLINVYVNDTTYQNSNYDSIFNPKAISDDMKASLEKKFNIKLIDYVGTSSAPVLTASHGDIKTNKIGIFNYKGQAFYKGYVVSINLKLTVKPDFTVNIPDARLKEALSKIFPSNNSKFKTIRRSMLDSIQYVTIKLNKNQDINTEGLQYLTHLKLISLDNINNLEPFINRLKVLPTFNQLQITNSNENNFVSLQKIKNLKYLTIQKCPNINLSSLAEGIKGSHLISLDLSNCKLTDITSLSKLYSTSIKSLNLESNNLTSISPISNLKNLNSLIISYNRIPDLSPIGSLSNLNYINFCYNKVNNIKFVNSLKNLNTMIGEGNFISDITPLRNSQNIHYLNLSSNYISDISPLKNKTNITSLGLENNYISDISVLKNLKDLTSLRCLGNQISDYNPTKGYFSKLQFKDFSLKTNEKVTKLKNETINEEIELAQGEKYNSQPMSIAMNYLAEKKGIQTVDRLRSTEWDVDTSKIGESKYSGIVVVDGYLFDVNLTVKVVAN